MVKFSLGLFLAAVGLVSAQTPAKLVGPRIVVKNPETLLGGPFVVNVGPKTATVAWVTRTGEIVGEAPTRQAVRRVSRSGRVIYKNLKPGTTYHYEFQGKEVVRGTFKTAPIEPVSFEFLVYGDTRTRHDAHQSVVDAMVKFDPDFVLHTGDLVANGTVTLQWPTFFSIEKELLRKTAFYPALGNHERHAPQYFEFLLAKPYYSFDWGAVHVAVINSDIGNVPGDKEERDRFWEEQTKWLENDLRESQGAAIRLVSFHHPPYTGIKRRGPVNKQTVQLVPLFEKYNVTAVLNGHDHNYQHFLNNGIHYVTTGGGGAPLYQIDAPPETMVKFETIENFVHVKVNGTTAVVRALAVDGREIDRFELKGSAAAAVSGIE